MGLMFRLRRKWCPSRLQPEHRFIRTLQSPHHVVFDERVGRYIVSSQAFNPSSSDGTLSGDLEEVLARDGLHPTAMYPAVRDPVGAATVTVADLRGVGATVEHDPVEQNWYHGAVRGTKARGVKKRLSAMALEIVPIDQAQAEAFDQAFKEKRGLTSS